MVGDRLEFAACDLELVCILYLVISEVSGQSRPQEALAPFEKETSREKPEAVARGWQ